MTTAPSFVGSFHGEGTVGVASLDPPLLQQTKSEIRTLAAEIAKLAHAAFEPAEFFNGFLPRLVTAMGAEAAAVWQTTQSLAKLGSTDAYDCDSTEPSLRLQAHYALPIELLSETEAPGGAVELPAPSEAHRRILQCVIAEGSPILVPPQAVNLETDRPVNPLEHSLIVIPVRIEEEVEFVLEVVQQASGGPAAQRGYLRFVAQMADLMADYLRRQALRQHALRASRLQQFEFWLSAIAQAQSPASQLRKLADGLADMLDCQQVLIVRTGRKPKVLAASGLDSFDPRSETILAAQVFERCVVRSARKLETREENVDSARLRLSYKDWPSFKELQGLMACESLTRLSLDERRGLVSILASTAAPTQHSPAEMDRIGSSLVGLVDPHAAATSLVGQWWPLRNPWPPATQLARTSLQQWSMRAALLGLLAAIALFPVPQQLTTTAVLAPQQKQVYYAPFNATVKEVLVRDEQAVAPGERLLRLANPTLQREDDRLKSEQVINHTTLSQLMYEQHHQRPSSDRLRELLFEIERLKSRIAENEEQQLILRAELSKLEVVAVERGTLTTWDVRNRLLNRPVNAGDMLLSTYQPEGGWELQLSIPEHRVGLVSQAIAGAAETGVRIRYSLISHPESLLEGRLNRLAEQATRNVAGANVVLATAVVGGDLPMRKEGAVARVTIDCGRVPAIWLIVRDAYWACVSRLKMIW